MTRISSLVAVFAPAVLVTAVCWAAVRPVAGVSGSAVPRPEDAPVPTVVGRPMGQIGCSSVGCHGGPGGSRDSWPTSALVWAAADPHRRAFAVLEEKLATDMMAHLHPDKMPEQRLASKDVRCLACHTNPALADTDDKHAIGLRSEGVSCEACHGNASGWTRSHFTPATREAAYTTGGLAKLNDLGERALACAGCHVGAPAGGGYPLRDMNHDMIAAGHPRLNFDFATYQFMLPKHWHERDRNKPDSPPDPDFEARAWLVGRVAHAEAACNLTADRAKRADPWPEYAEYSCVACHHRIGDGAYPAPTGRPLGSLPWQPIWPVAEKVPAFAAVGAAARGPRAKTEEAARTAAAELARLRVGLRGATAAEWMKAVPAGAWDRDLTEQVYHAAAARERTRGEGADRATFAAIAADLRLTRGDIRFHVSPETVKTVRALVK